MLYILGAPFLVCSVVFQRCVKRKCAQVFLEDRGTSLLAAPRRAQARLDGHIQLLFKNCPGVYAKGKGTAAPWLLLLGDLLEVSVS